MEGLIRQDLIRRTLMAEDSEDRTALLGPTFFGNSTYRRYYTFVLKMMPTF
jgi:hypothetical protein